jgi:hypothetical protein
VTKRRKSAVQAGCTRIGWEPIRTPQLIAGSVITCARSTDVQQVVQAHGAFVRRAFAFCRAQGIDQFLMLGDSSSLAMDVQLVRDADRTDRVLLVDSDPAAVPRSQALLEAYPNASIRHADLHQLGKILDNPEVRQAIDVTRPLAVMFSGMLPYITDDEESYAVVRALRAALPSGSYRGLTHMTDENLPREVLDEFEVIYAASFQPIRTRGQAQVERYFDGLEVVAPGVVALPRWRPGSDDILLDRPERSLGLVGVGYTP